MTTILTVCYDGKACCGRNSEKLSAGETPEQILQAHPRLTRDGIYAALAFAAQSLRADVVYPILEKAALKKMFTKKFGWKQ